ncbi:Nudix hydrolase [Hibiscus syriacus]|uniref:Nudix hydrolase n=1 Tax=Hibiscus syriacus TaxID=106335 RepID=A0A6A3ACJ3_HIBSY|nr:Nudix hydrolase [Hibiscus syriacus]
MDFKAFQSVLSRKIGITPNQFTVYIVDSDNLRNRVAITSKVKKRKEGEIISLMPAIKNEPPMNAMLLRRGDGGVNNLMEVRVFKGLDAFERRVRDLQMEERYLVNMGSANLRIGRESKSLVCEECENAEVAVFHWCVYDAVTFSFQTHGGGGNFPTEEMLR